MSNTDELAQLLGFADKSKSGGLSFGRVSGVSGNTVQLTAIGIANGEPTSTTAQATKACDCRKGDTVVLADVNGTQLAIATVGNRDSGTRYIPYSQGSLMLRRVGNVVTVFIDALQTDTSGFAEIITIPAGFRPAFYLRTPMYAGAGMGVVGFFADGSTVAYSPVSTNVTWATVTYITDDDFPE